MYGHNPKEVLRVCEKVYSDETLDCCTAANRVFSQLNDFDPLRESNTDDAKTLMKRVKDKGSLEEAINYTLLSVGLVKCDPEPGDLVFIRGACGICLGANLYATRGIVGLSIIVENNVRGWTCQK